MAGVEDDDDLGGFESVERRGQPRGSFHGLTIALQHGPPLAVTEASQLSFFAEMTNPDSTVLGLETAAELRYRGQMIRVTIRVVRKEHEPRRGVVLQVVDTDPAVREALRELLAVEP